MIRISSHFTATVPGYGQECCLNRLALHLHLLDVLLLGIQSIKTLYRLLVPASDQHAILRYAHCPQFIAYIVNTIPPLSISRAKRGTAPDQNVIIPSSLNILAAQTKLFLYSFGASIDCMLAALSQYRCSRLRSRAGSPGLDRIQRLRYIADAVVRKCSTAGSGKTRLTQ